MTRAELNAALAARFPQFSQEDCGLAMRLILDAIIRALANGGRVEIRGFGVFSLNFVPPHQRRNPRTGDPMQVPGKYRPRFKAGKELRERVDGAMIDVHEGSSQFA